MDQTLNDITKLARSVRDGNRSVGRHPALRAADRKDRWKPRRVFPCLSAETGRTRSCKGEAKMSGELLFVIYYGGMVSLMGVLMNRLVKREYHSEAAENRQSITSR